MDVAGVVANGGGAGVSAADPGSIACIAPSEKDCRPGTAGCPVGTPVANGCPIGPGAKPCPTVAGEKGLLGAAETEGAIGAPVPGRDGLPAGSRGWCSRWHRSVAARPRSDTAAGAGDAAHLCNPALHPAQAAGRDQLPLAAARAAPCHPCHATSATPLRTT